MKRCTRPLTLSLLCATLLLAPVAQADHPNIELDAGVSHPFVLADSTNTTYLRVALTGFPLKDESKRTPVNLAIVLDRSGSMQGEKLARAKEAAILAIEKLRSDDIVSIVVYDSTVRVLVPATRASDRENIFSAIRQIGSGGSTALFGGVSKGAAEVRKFLDDQHVNRLILLSDGIANAGPSSPGDLAELGSSLMREGMSVSTIGLGLDYNEDLMTQLAQKSEGNHYFAENATDLARTFANELGDVLSVVAKDLSITIKCARGVRPVRVLGREAVIDGQTVTASISQLYSEQMKYVVLEVETPSGKDGAVEQVASVDVSYANIPFGATDRMAASVDVTYTTSPDIVEARRDKDVLESVVGQIAAGQNRLAMRLRDEGKIEEARALLWENSGFIGRNNDFIGSKDLERIGVSNSSNAINLDGENYLRERKVMQKLQYDIITQQKIQESDGGGDLSRMSIKADPLYMGIVPDQKN
jgi:Ca-activated chloride channel family protein